MIKFVVTLLITKQQKNSDANNKNYAVGFTQKFGVKLKPLVHALIPDTQT